MPPQLSKQYLLEMEKLIAVLFLSLMIYRVSISQQYISNYEDDESSFQSFTTDFNCSAIVNDDSEEFTKQYAKNLKTGKSQNPNMIYTIPTVVHIIHAGLPVGDWRNPTDEVVHNLVEEVSQRLRHMHPGAGSYANPLYGADSEIELCLVKQDENGNYINGISRHYDPLAARGLAGSGGTLQYEWDRSKYFNIYITDQQYNNIWNAGTAGYGVHATVRGATLTLVHEVGHYFSLAHTFFSGCTNNDCLNQGDRVCDTPPKAGTGLFGAECDMPGNNCTTDEDDSSNNNPYRSISLGGMGDQPDMLSNYMDYSGPCWDSFTEGQKIRMRTYVESNLMSIAENSAKCQGPSIPQNDVAVLNFEIIQDNPCDEVLDFQIDIKNTGLSSIESIEYSVMEDSNVLFGGHFDLSLPSGANSNYYFQDVHQMTGFGQRTLQFVINKVNGQIDDNSYNNSFHNDDLFLLNYTPCYELEYEEQMNNNSQDGPGNYSIVNLNRLPAIDGTAEGIVLCFDALGDVDFRYEIFKVLNADGDVLTYTNTSSSSCAEYSEKECVFIDKSTYESWAQNNMISIYFDPIVSGVIMPNLCTNNSVRVTLHFAGSNQISGCTDSIAHNYNANAVFDDNSCMTCFDQIKNGDELQKDCGGSFCSPCDCDVENITIALDIDQSVEISAVNKVNMLSTVYADATISGGSSICLEPNFSIDSGARVHLAIEECFGDLVLLAPENNDVLDNGCLDDIDLIEWDFDWSDVSRVQYYNLYVKSVLAQNPLINDLTIPGIQSSYHYTGRGRIPFPSDWFWRVRAFVDGEWSEWSEERYFTCEDPDILCN